jgi:hypothetical protein
MTKAQLSSVRQFEQPYRPWVPLREEIFLGGGQQFRLAPNSDNMIFGAFTFDENKKPGAKYRRIARCVVEFICSSLSGLRRSTYF